MSNSNSNSTSTARDAIGSPLYNLTIGDKSYPIKFNITGIGILDTMAIDGDQAILLVNINASTGGGNLETELPRDLIDSKTHSNTDKPYSVFEDDVDRQISYMESKTTDQARSLVFQLKPPVNTREEIKIPLKREEVEAKKEPYVKEGVVLKKERVTEKKAINEEVRGETLVES